MRRLHATLGIILALASLLIAAPMAAAHPLPRAAAAAAPMRISGFYAITKAAYDAWGPKSSAPARTRAFPKGTADVGYYIHYQNVVAKTTTYQVIIYDHTGAVYVKGSKHALSYANGEQLNYFGGGGPFDTGAYRMDLLIGNIVAATTTFGVGAAPPTAAQISTDHATGQRINALYAITKTAYNAWQPKSPAPARTRAFPKGTTDIGYYVDYQGVMAKTTTFQIIIYDQSGAAYVTGSKHTFPYKSGEQLNYFGGGGPFDKGTYRMDLIMHGIVAASATFTVGA